MKKIAIALIVVSGLVGSLLYAYGEEKVRNDEDDYDIVFECESLLFKLDRYSETTGHICEARVWRDKKWKTLTCVIDKDEDLQDCEDEDLD